MNRFLEKTLDLAAGPIPTRELRATFRGWRFVLIFTGALGLALFVLWTTAFALTADREPSSVVGQTTFMVLLAVQAGLIGLLLPGFAGTSIVRERDHQTFELLSTTTIHPWQIVWGQLMASMGYVAVFLFATLPLMAFPFWFGGLAGWEPVVAYVGLFLFSALIAVWCLYVSASSNSISRATIMCYLFVFVAMGPVVGAMAEIIDDMSRGRNELSELIELVSVHWVSFSLNGAFLFLAPFAFLFIAAVNRLKPFGSNRATPVRIYTACLLPATAALFLGDLRAYLVTAHSLERMGFGLFTWFVLAFLCTAVAFQSTEGPISGRRLIKQLDRLRNWRFPFRLFAPGGTRGALFTVALASATCLVAGALLVRIVAWDADDPLGAVATPLAVVLAQTAFAAGLGLFLGSLKFPRVLSCAAWFAAVLAVPLASGVWMLASENGLPDSTGWDVPGWLCFPYVLWSAWFAHAPNSPEAAFIVGHVPVWRPFVASHLIAGLALGLLGAVSVISQEASNRADALRTPDPEPAPPPPVPALSEPTGLPVGESK